MLEIGEKSVQELRKLRITKVEWHSIRTLQFTLSDGQSCKTDTSEFTSEMTDSHIFDPTKKITRVEVNIHKSEFQILQINFYFNEELLVTVGGIGHLFVSYGGRRREVFSIAEDEQLIGCELNQDNFHRFCGVTWIKMKVSI